MVVPLGSGASVDRRRSAPSRPPLEEEEEGVALGPRPSLILLMLKDQNSNIWSIGWWVEVWLKNKKIR